MSKPGAAPTSAGDQITAAALAVLSLLAGGAWLLGLVAATVTGNPTRAPGLADALTGAAAWPKHRANPARGYPDAVRQALPGPLGMWMALAVALLLVLGGAAAAAHVIRSIRPADGRAVSHSRGAGFASRHEVRSQLSERAVRDRAAHASLDGSRRYPTTAVGLRLGRDMHTRLDVWGSVEDSYLILGPPRSGKGVHLVIPHTLDAPGPVLVTSTRPDTLQATLRVRRQHGPVIAFDPQQLAPDAPRLRWSPTRGCSDPLVAISRARALSAGAGINHVTTTDADFWSGMAAAVLRAYLHAAALTGRSMGDVLAWAGRPLDPTPMRILRSESGAAPGWAEELAAQASADPRQRDSVWAGVRRAVDALADPRVLATCSPDDQEGFDPTEFLHECGSLYLLGSTGTQLSVAPLITALLEDVLDTARTLAAAERSGRLTPPLLLLLDEAANIAPIPTLPNLLADGGGVGITTVTVLQSLAQARSRWGDAGADAMWDAATTKVIFGGLAHAEDLTRISRLAGEIDAPHVTHNTGNGGGSRSITSQRIPALPLEQIRCLPAGQALVLARRCPPAHVRLTPWWQHPAQNDRTPRRRHRP